jgi:hypothetical protein
MSRLQFDESVERYIYKTNLGKMDQFEIQRCIGIIVVSMLRKIR